MTPSSASRSSRCSADPTYHRPFQEAAVERSAAAFLWWEVNKSSCLQYMQSDAQNAHLDRSQTRQIWFGKIWRFLSVTGMLWIVVLHPVPGQQIRMAAPILSSLFIAVSMLVKKETLAQIRSSIWAVATLTLAISILITWWVGLSWSFQFAIWAAFVSFAISSRYLAARMPDLVVAPAPVRSADPESW